MNKKTVFYTIPNDCLLDKRIKPIDKFLLMILENRKLLSTRNKNSYEIKIRPKKLRELSFIKDNRTLKQCLFRLKGHGYIDFDFDVLSSGKIEMVIHCHKKFTMVDQEMVDRISNLEICKDKPFKLVILYFILEFYYNTTLGDGKTGMSYPSREMIKESLVIRDDHMTEYFKIMHNEKICQFYQGRKVTGNIRERNKYLPNTIQHKKGEPNIGSRRYIINKSDQYFNLGIDEEFS